MLVRLSRRKKTVMKTRKFLHSRNTDNQLKERKEINLENTDILTLILASRFFDARVLTGTLRESLASSAPLLLATLASPRRVQREPARTRTRESRVSLAVKMHSLSLSLDLLDHSRRRTRRVRASPRQSLP